MKGSAINYTDSRHKPGFSQAKGTLTTLALNLSQVSTTSLVDPEQFTSLF